MEANERDDDHGHQAAQPAWNAERADPVCREAGQQAAHQAAQEACAHEAGNSTGHETGRDAGPVRDAEGDVAGQRRDQEAEGQSADLEGTVPRYSGPAFRVGGRLSRVLRARMSLAFVPERNVVAAPTGSPRQ